MDTQHQKWLSKFAECAGVEIEFPEGSPIRITGRVNDEPFPIAVKPDQPDCDLLTSQNHQLWPFPWYLDRPYQNEFLGDAVFKTRRILKQKLNLRWRSKYWAICVYCQTGWHKEFGTFLKRHPEKMKLWWLFLLGLLRAQSLQNFRTFLGVLCFMLAARLAAKNL
jgi:hypothetical protein